MQAASGSKRKGLAIFVFSWPLMHCFLPFINLQHALCMFIMFMPLTIFMGLMYMRIKRLAPFIVAHWMMDAANVIFMTAAIQSLIDPSRSGP